MSQPIRYSFLYGSSSFYLADIDNSYDDSRCVGCGAKSGQIHQLKCSISESDWQEARSKLPGYIDPDTALEVERFE